MFQLRSALPPSPLLQWFYCHCASHPFSGTVPEEREGERESEIERERERVQCSSLNIRSATLMMDLVFQEQDKRKKLGVQQIGVSNSALAKAKGAKIGRVRPLLHFCDRSFVHRCSIFGTRKLCGIEQEPPPAGISRKTRNAHGSSQPHSLSNQQSGAFQMDQVRRLGKCAVLGRLGIVPCHIWGP